jgi:hypothetical protein
MNLTGQKPYQKEGTKRFTAEEQAYYEWLHQFECIVTGYHPFEIAHTGGIAEGKGMSRKAHLETCLPLRRELHLIEEADSERFWTAIGLPHYLKLAKSLHEYFIKDENPLLFIRAVQDEVRRDVVFQMMRGGWKWL